MDELITKLAKDFPAIKFTAGEIFCWSPSSQEIIYNPTKTKPSGRWAVLHELAHALLGHTSYSYDFELVKLEVAAWHKAQELENKYSQKINQEHIQNCLDTYREWLYRRSLCPTCGNSSLQQAPGHYHCFNCQTVWKVTTARFCRPYRLKEDKSQQTSEIAKPQQIKYLSFN